MAHRRPCVRSAERGEDVTNQRMADIYRVSADRRRIDEGDR